MNNFNNVFLIIKKYSGEKGMMEGKGIFERIARDANITPAKLVFVLKTLQDLGLIKYSTEGEYIKLTAFGKKQERLFMDGNR
jgi:Mn-dependent DtxR family transcriptional regulator